MTSNEMSTQRCHTQFDFDDERFSRERPHHITRFHRLHLGGNHTVKGKYAKQSLDNLSWSGGTIHSSSPITTTTATSNKRSFSRLQCQSEMQTHIGTLKHDLLRIVSRLE